jgi:hypothetical protein
MENFLVIVGGGLMLINAIGVLYYGLFYLLGLSGQAGTKISKGTRFYANVGEFWYTYTLYLKVDGEEVPVTTGYPVIIDCSIIK